MVGAIPGTGIGKVFLGLVEPSHHFRQLSAALGRNQGRIQRSLGKCVVSGLRALCLGLHLSVLRVQLQQPRRGDIGLLLRIDQIQFPLQIGQPGPGRFHIGAQFIQLVLHEGGKSLRAADPKIVGVLNIRSGDAIGDFGRQVSVGRTIGNLQNVRVRRMRHLHPFQAQGRADNPGYSLRAVLAGFDLLFFFQQRQFLHSRANDGIALQNPHLRIDVVVGVRAAGHGGLRFLPYQILGRSPVDVQSSGGFVDADHARSCHRGNNQNQRYKSRHLEKIGAQQPKVVGHHDVPLCGPSLLHVHATR